MAANCDDASADGASSAPTHGSINSADSYFDMSTSSPPTAPSSTSPTAGSLCAGVYEIGSLVLVTNKSKPALAEVPSAVDVLLTSRHQNGKG